MRRLARTAGEKRETGNRGKTLAGSGIALLLGAAALPAWADGPAAPTSSVAQAAPAADALPKWGPFIDFDGKAGTQRNIGEGDLFVPLLQNGSSMLFTDIRARFDDKDSHEGNFGLGLRHMLASGWNLGLYGYYDRRHTALDDDFGQATVGAEALSLDWDARANLYRTVGPRVANLGDTSASTASLSGTSVQVTTTGTHSQEVALHGFDGEVGWRVPIFDAVDTTQFRVYAGGYDFESSGVRSVAGPRGRLDLTLHEVPHLWTGARLEMETEVQHDGPRGTQAFALLSLRIPLQIFASAAPSALTPMERRMTDRIVRDVDVVTEARAVATPTIVETATETSNGTPFTLINSASTTGANLGTAVQAAGSGATVILSGTFNVGSGGSFATGFNQTVRSGGISVSTASGHTATLNTSATITGTNPPGNGTVELKAGTTLQGLTITSTATAGSNAKAVVVDDNAVSATLTNNTITATASGAGSNAIAVTIGHNTTVNATGNTFTATGTTGIVSAFEVNLGQALTAANNRFSASGGTANRLIDLSGNTITGSTGNTRGSGTCVGTAASGEVSFTDGTHCP